MSVNTHKLDRIKALIEKVEAHKNYNDSEVDAEDRIDIALEELESVVADVQEALDDILDEEDPSDE